MVDRLLQKYTDKLTLMNHVQRGESSLLHSGCCSTRRLVTTGQTRSPAAPMTLVLCGRRSTNCVIHRLHVNSSTLRPTWRHTLSGRGRRYSEHSHYRSAPYHSPHSCTTVPLTPAVTAPDVLKVASICYHLRRLFQLRGCVRQNVMLHLVTSLILTFRSHHLASVDSCTSATCT